MEKSVILGSSPGKVISAFVPGSHGLQAQTRLGDTRCQAASRRLRAQLCHGLPFQHYESYSGLFAFLAMAEEGGGE